jgi:hypothetical protein
MTRIIGHLELVIGHWELVRTKIEIDAVATQGADSSIL